MARSARPSNSKPGPGTGVGDIAILAGGGTALAFSFILLLGGALAAMLFGAGWTWPPTADLASTAWGVLTHADRPSTGYPADLSGRIPGAVPFWGVTGSLMASTIITATLSVIATLSRRSTLGYATRRELADQLGPASLRRAADELRPGGLTAQTGLTSNPTTSKDT